MNNYSYNNIFITICQAFRIKKIYFSIKKAFRKNETLMMQFIQSHRSDSTAAQSR